jgi:hypothetical protein
MRYRIFGGLLLVAAIRRVYLELDGKLDKEVPLAHAN